MGRSGNSGGGDLLRDRRLGHLYQLRLSTWLADSAIRHDRIVVKTRAQASCH